MKKIIAISTLFVFLLLVIQGCGSKKNAVDTTTAVSDKEKQTIESIGGTWVLKTFNGELSKDIFPRRTPIITIDTKTKEITGNGGCNGMSGLYSYRNGIFSAPNMISTMMFCEDAPKESQLMKMLAEESVVKAVDGFLTFSQKGQVVARFAQGIDSELLLGAWVLKTIDDVKVSNTDAPTIEFASEENISGFGGCNRYSSNVEIDGQKITFGPILSTRMACQDMNTEVNFFKALSEVNAISVSRDTLSLSLDQKTLLVFTK